MTQQRTFKQRIRERMQKTGERYTTARYHLLQKSNSPAAPNGYPGLVPGYRSFGGVQGDSAVVRNVFEQAGIRNPLTEKPYTEAFVNGLCGGIGFLYATFEYRGLPPMLTMVLRSKSMPDVFIDDVFRRAGAETTVATATSDKVARRALDDALAAGRPPICVVDTALIRYYGMLAEMAGMSPQHVAVVGVQDGQAWLDDRAVQPTRIDLDQLAAARAGYRKAKRRMMTVTGVPADHDLSAGVREAIAETVTALTEGAVGAPASFRSNCGFAGLEKWQKLLTDRRDKKGWPKLFAGGAAAWAGLRRAYDCIEREYTAPAAGRAFYADFLDEAEACGAAAGLKGAAGAFRKSAEAWQRLAQLIASVDDPAVRRACAITNERAELLDTRGSDAADDLAALAAELGKLGDECRLTPELTAPLYAELADVLREVIALEREAVDQLRAAS